MFLSHIVSASSLEKRSILNYCSLPLLFWFAVSSKKGQQHHVVVELNERDEAGNDARPQLEALPPPTLPGPAFHFNKKVPMRSTPATTEDLQTRLAQVEEQIAKRQRKTDQRSASFQALLKERAVLHTQIEMQEKGSH